MNRNNTIIKIIVFILVLGSTSAGLLVMIDAYTEVRIKRNQDLQFKESILQLVGLQFNHSTVDSVFAKNIAIHEFEDIKYYKSKDSLVIFEFSGPGLWGEIKGLIALYPDLKTIYGMRILYQEETPGLGARIKEESFLNKFKDKIIIPEIKLVSPNEVKRANEVEAITGATMTSRALEQILNQNLQRFLNKVKE